MTVPNSLGCLDSLIVWSPPTLSRENLQEIARETNRLFFAQKLAIIPVKWTNSQRKAGSYHAIKVGQQLTSQEIRLSSILLKPRTIVDLLSVLVHEQIHQYQVECTIGEDYCHGATFKAQMKRINHMQDLFEIRVTHNWDTRAHAKWIGCCPNCGYTLKTHRRYHRSCGQCDRKYNPYYQLIYYPNPDLAR